MEIKQGDKVRVSKDAPKVYTNGSFDMFYMAYDSEVLEVEDDHAVIKSSVHVQPTARLIIPTKYLIKVDAEAKEPKIKKDDRVKYIGKEHPEYWGEIFTVDGEIFYNDYHKNMQISSIRCETYNLCNVPLSDIVLYTAPTAPTIKAGDRVRCKNPIRLANSTDDDFIGTVTDAEYGWFRVHMNNGAIFQTYHESDLELVQPTEQTEAEKKPNVGSIKIPVEVDLSDSYWDAYIADLAKEIAVKVVNKHMDSNPKEVGKYAAEVAKAVVEGLKRK